MEPAIKDAPGMIQVSGGLQKLIWALHVLPAQVWYPEKNMVPWSLKQINKNFPLSRNYIQVELEKEQKINL
jgi:hypothetical protein